MNSLDFRYSEDSYTLFEIKIRASFTDIFLFNSLKTIFYSCFRLIFPSFSVSKCENLLKNIK